RPDVGRRRPLRRRLEGQGGARDLAPGGDPARVPTALARGPGIPREPRPRRALRTAPEQFQPRSQWLARAGRRKAESRADGPGGRRQLAVSSVGSSAVPPPALLIPGASRRRERRLALPAGGVRAWTGSPLRRLHAPTSR